MLDETFDIAIIGAGMAGASLAAECAPYARVLLVEGEETPGYHTTGRSAAFWEETYGGPGVVPLTVASGAFLREAGFLAPRGALTIGRAEDRQRVEAFAQTFANLGVDVRLIERAGLAALVPGLRDDWRVGAYAPGCADIDVAALHAHYLALSRQAGTVVRVRARVDRIEREGTDWRLSWQSGPQDAGSNATSQARAGLLVNAAGAWADLVAVAAGAKPLGISPLRRTVAQLRINPSPPDNLPLTFGIDQDFYFKPQAGRLWLSPHDETPDIARDVAPEELAVAQAIDRLSRVADWRVAAVERRWAGLRSFAPDRLPVYGFDTKQAGLFWFAGQGGFGIQTAPAAARLGAQLLLGLPADAMTESLDPSRYRPGRLS